MKTSKFIKKLIKQAKKDKKRIILPEGNDPRVLEAANYINKEGIADIILIGSRSNFASYFEEKGYSTEGIHIINPKRTKRLEKYADLLFELRQRKGMTKEKALEVAMNNNYFATLMVKSGDADGLVSGAVGSTADTVRPALQIVKSAKPGVSVSAFFLMVVNDEPYIFSDCGLVENPNEEELANIAIQSSETAISLGVDPKVAMLSYSTYGSANNPLVDKVVNATKLAKEKLASDEYKHLDVILDGEMQLDSAIVPEVAASKCPTSPVGGQAKVLIFPELNSGNICYKLVQRMGGAEAYGPVLQGLNAPINDLSRGCSAEDIIGVVAITALQANKK